MLLESTLSDGCTHRWQEFMRNWNGISWCFAKMFIESNFLWLWLLQPVADLVCLIWFYTVTQGIPAFGLFTEQLYEQTCGKLDSSTARYCESRMSCLLCTSPNHLPSNVENYDREGVKASFLVKQAQKPSMTAKESLIINETGPWHERPVTKGPNHVQWAGG